LLDFIRHERLTMAARIQLVLNLSFFIPLIAVSVITLGLTARSTQEQLNAEYLAKSRNFTSSIIAALSETPVNKGISAEQSFIELASTMSLDANIFTAGGKLEMTTQSLIFDNSLMAPYVNPAALARIHKDERFFIINEQVGKLSFFVVYSALHSPIDGRLVGIAAIPFFRSAHLLEKMQIAVLANILSIFTAIFMVLLLVSYRVSIWLTFPLRMIARKLGRTSLTNSNQPLEWQSDDEIGLMVKEYNQMLSTLSENKKELERTQRERAWREIAQQVAHEIKNPLTPMKLALQKLERLSDDDPDKFEKIQKAVASVLSQVDTLDGVASSFSAFAKMPEPVMRKVEMTGLLRRTITLHSQAAPIDFSCDAETVYVMADEQLLGRIFSNIVLNSIQAQRENVPVHVGVSVELTDSRCRVSVTDNGAGIEESFRDKVFLPHFSTKKSGSGLGLAIARQGIEQMGGTIWFETTPGSGTTFFFELPLIPGGQH
jgi:two-component system nitrogen regulation sensor histidine kinase NtrY